MAKGATIEINGVACSYFMPNGRLIISESSTEEGPRVGTTYMVPFGSRWDLVSALRGFTVAQGTGLMRQAPYALPWAPNLVCSSIGEFGYVGSGVDDDGELFAQYATLPATFSPVPWQFVDGDPGGQNDASGQAWTVTKIKPSAEVFQPQGGTFYLSGHPLDEASAGFVRANTEIQVTRKQLPGIPMDALSTAIGKVNQYAMVFGDKTYFAETLLLAGAETEPYYDAVGNPVLDLQLTYLGRLDLGSSWNKAQDNTGTWGQINTKADGSGNPPFKQYDFKTLPR